MYKSVDMKKDVKIAIIVFIKLRIGTNKNLHIEGFSIRPQIVLKKKERMRKRKWCDNQRRVFVRDTTGLLFSFSMSNDFFPAAKKKSAPLGTLTFPSNFPYQFVR